jgi:hypothetical protein
MKRALFLSLAAASLVAVALITGCENGWTTNDSGFNSSEGAGATINFSGYYQGMNGGRAVATTSSGNIMTLTIQQGGNTVEVVDNQGSTYRGTIGSPGAVSPSSESGYSTGAQLAQAQINFSGHDNVSGKDISFAGVIHAVSISDITTEDSSDELTDETTTSIKDGTNTVSTTTKVFGTLNSEFYRVVTETVTTTPTDEVIERIVKTIGTTSYSLTEANTQYRLQGTWVEDGGVVSGVDAISPASAGLITTTTSTTTTGQ